MGGVGEEFVPLAVQRTGGDADAEISELRRRIGSGKRARLSAGCHEAPAPERKKKLFSVPRL